MKTVSYLVIWQLGTNINTRTETALDVIIEDDFSAQDKYDAIMDKLESVKRVAMDESVTVISVSKL